MYIYFFNSNVNLYSPSTAISNVLVIDWKEFIVSYHKDYYAYLLKLEYSKVIMIISKTSLYVSVSIILVLIMIIHLTIDTANNINSKTIIGNSNRELLSTEFQITDGQYVKTYNGIVPLTKCPPGSYR